MLFTGLGAESGRLDAASRALPVQQDSAAAGDGGCVLSPQSGHSHEELEARPAGARLELGPSPKQPQMPPRVGCSGAQRGPPGVRGRGPRAATGIPPPPRPTRPAKPRGIREGWVQPSLLALVGKWPLQPGAWGLGCAARLSAAWPCTGAQGAGVLPQDTLARLSVGKGWP